MQERCAHECCLIACNPVNIFLWVHNSGNPPAWGGSLPEPYKRLDAAVVFPPRLTRVKTSSAVSC